MTYCDCPKRIFTTEVCRPTVSLEFHGGKIIFVQKLRLSYGQQSSVYSVV